MLVYAYMYIFFHQLMPNESYLDLSSFHMINNEIFFYILSVCHVYSKRETCASRDWTEYPINSDPMDNIFFGAVSNHGVGWKC